MKPETVAEQFNAEINAHSLGGLSVLMTDNHQFVDPAGGQITGRTECLKAWQDFFEAYPSYQNIFESTTVDGGTVTIRGRSICTELAELDGPAVWTAVVEGHRVSVWQVKDDTSER